MNIMFNTDFFVVHDHARRIGTLFDIRAFCAEIGLVMNNNQQYTERSGRRELHSKERHSDCRPDCISDRVVHKKIISKGSVRKRQTDAVSPAVVVNNKIFRVVHVDHDENRTAETSPISDLSKH